MGRFNSTVRMGVLILLIACSLAARTSPVSAQVTGTLPILTSAVHAPEKPGQFVVRGESFTPGGDVFIAVYDAWGGEVLLESRWTKASGTTSTVFRGGDIITLSQEGGELMEAFNVSCGIEVMARAFDKATETWTDALQIDAGCAGEQSQESVSSQEPMLPPAKPDDCRGSCPY